MTETTTRRPAEIARPAVEQNLRDAWASSRPTLIADAVLRYVSFDAPSSDLVQAIVRLLDRIAQLDADADAVHAHEIASFPAQIASAAIHGYSLPLLATVERVAALLDSYDREVALVQRGSAWVIGTVTIEARTETFDRGTAWPETVEIPAQTVEVLYHPNTAAFDHPASATFAATSVRREHGAQLGGVDVVRRVDETPRETAHGASARGYEAARSIATTGRLFGGEIVLAKGVEIVAARYAYKGSTPTSLAWEIRLPA